MISHHFPPGKAICWFAESEQCDMIVMGTHGRTGLSHLLFGSIAEYVMRHARCPVVTVRERPSFGEPLQEPLARPLPPPRFM
ncbi:MAG: universal stress protein [Planctomycetes bacterium]|nr:universal stress protein [Planctomycetota bacterium]